LGIRRGWYQSVAWLFVAGRFHREVSDLVLEQCINVPEARLKFLNLTHSGCQWIANLHNHLLCAEHGHRLMGLGCSDLRARQGSWWKVRLPA
jgi:hypothetical protein